MGADTIVMRSLGGQVEYGGQVQVQVSVWGADTIAVWSLGGQVQYGGQVPGGLVLVLR